MIDQWGGYFGKCDLSSNHHSLQTVTAPLCNLAVDINRFVRNFRIYKEVSYKYFFTFPSQQFYGGYYFHMIVYSKNIREVILRKLKMRKLRPRVSNQMTNM